MPTLIIAPSGGRNLVLWPAADPNIYEASHTAPASVEVWIGKADEAPTEANLFAIYRPGEMVRIPRSLAVDKSLRIFLRAVAPSGKYDRTYLTEAYSFDVSWAKKPPILDSIDSERPTVGAAPTITRIDQPGITEWGIYMPRPTAYGFSADNVEVRIRQAGTLDVVRQLAIGNTSLHRHPMFAFDCVIDYRWRNRYRESGSDGWSDWSPTSDAWGLSNPTDQNMPDSELKTFANDPDDQSNPLNRQTLYLL